MKDYEKDLKKLLDLTDHGQKPIHEDASEMDRQRLVRLKNKGLIRLPAAGDNKVIVIIEDAGESYFEDRSERIRDFFLHYALNNLIAFGALVVAIISLLRTL